MKPLYKLIPTTLCVVLSLSVPTRSSGAGNTNSEMVTSCIQAIKVDNRQLAKKLAAEIAEFKNLFSVTTIKMAEQCLQKTFGAHWKYFSTRGRFLSGDQALEEQAYISGASDRKAKLEKAKMQLSGIEMEFGLLREAGAVEVQNETLKACSILYGQNQAQALVNSVCNNSFSAFGLPNSMYSLEINKLVEARLKLEVALIEMQRAKVAIK